MDSPFSLKDKIILITGASSGIGRATALECSKQNARLVITGRNVLRLNETFNMLYGAGHLQFVTDLTSTEEIKRLAASIPFLDGLVHCAGQNKRELCQYIKDESLEALIKTNLQAPILLTKHLLKSKRMSTGGSIVFVSSVAVSHSSIGDSVYSATKGGINSYARVLALELASKQIRVNCIQPGMIHSDFWKHGPLNDEDYKADENKYPLGRYGKPEEIAYSIVFLLSDATRWMTGSSLVLDGGWSLI
jgi:NAD(P)-dependent dehydrogenase (short-subunit alcohol dehydrogenase family)